MLAVLEEMLLVSHILSGPMQPTVSKFGSTAIIVGPYALEVVLQDSKNLQARLQRAASFHETKTAGILFQQVCSRLLRCAKTERPSPAPLTRTFRPPMLISSWTRVGVPGSSLQISTLSHVPTALIRCTTLLA